MVDWISEQVSARQSLEVESNKGVINQISTVSRGAHPLSVVALAIALAALVIAIATFVTVNPMLRLVWAAISAVIFRNPLRCFYAERKEMGSNQYKIVSALEGHHKRIEYRARLARRQTLEAMDTQVAIVLHSSGKSRLDYGQQPGLGGAIAPLPHAGYGTGTRTIHSYFQV